MVGKQRLRRPTSKEAPSASSDSSDIEGNDDQLYGDIDHLREMVGDSGNESISDLDIASDSDGDHNYIDNDYDSASSGKDSLLAEFSDYEEGSDEDDEQNFMDAIREANNFKVKRRKKKNGKVVRTRRDRVIDPEVADILSRANEAFVRNDLQVAEGLYNEIIKKDPRNFAAYETLGDIYQLQGRLNDCCNSWFLAAHINSSDWEFWKIVAILSADLEHYRQAIYCFSRVININHEEWECVYRRATLYKKIGQLGKALEGFQKLYKNHPLDATFLRELAILYVDYDKVDEAIELYKNVYETNIHRRWAIENAMENAMDSSSSSDEEDEDNDDQLSPSNKEKKKKKQKSNEDEDVDENLADEHLEEMELYPEINWKKINRKYKCIPFDWSSLNIVAELYLKSPLGGVAGIKVLKAYARWIERRENQTFWNDVVDDSEYDMRKTKNSRYDALPNSEKEKSYTLPIDIRVRLGLLRLSNDNFTEAMNQFQFLYDENFEDTADLHFEVAVALTKAEKFQESIDFFLPLSSIEDFQNVQLYECLGKCYKEIENYEFAKDNYEKAIELDPTILENKLDLAEVYYHMGNNEMFKSLLQEVTEIRKKQDAALYGSIENESKQEKHKTVDERDKSSKPLLEDSMFRQYNSKRKKTPQDIEREKIDRERKITTKVVDKYKSLDDYEKEISEGNEKLIRSWIDTVSDLVDVFSSIKNFFVRNRSKKFVGIIRRTKKFNTVLDYQLERLSKLSEGDNLSDGLPLMEERVTLTSTTELRGLTYDQWFELFMNLSLTLTKYQSVEDGLSIIETAQEVNVFIQAPERAKMMKFVKLAIVLERNNEEEISENLRGLLNQYQFNRKVLEIFLLSLSQGQMSSDIISSTVQQKFFLRQIKAFDSCRFATHVNGQASVTNKEVVNPDKIASPYLYYIYAVLLYSSRGFLSALQYLSWLEKDTPDDPMVNLLMGLCHTHRSMQRLTANRHFQFLHGLRYLYRYYDIRSTMYSELESQEADYNVGRAFHLMGLTSIAITYYNKVLTDYKDDKLKKHAAYNSIVIYQGSGNIKLANHIMEQYLSI
ncbi:similar to Saccharomyces cerevisiae YGR047C TFC4 One of six subunits of the RNA polymerase III transcription initiation factor complex (TFIIIC) [Maudiozyma barnettii]|mgnify:CR=1 FL=1|uniref:Similar to Saccharomyces cerevisiae YGR047C TFC4 One of six subunits of the RNA polymerase III transcription initiation factor complex (TFIIIC) n=1 Tax=Maudiozyma barnettii TaxID=61262 RepID=A0A8H2VDI4_9SACH|nr:transcription factor TFIIIC subunit TFC4 [Kazachstania barnettii]CAB4253322.1 similar to Saccharomyces cerevisiae YGR047C TFC4 One of six subunits of the RNA polymerase III transcription initiation factor complex (TFIIIC) [Kazachstania barnettii]CAD1780836.1 similar to Saccharomyces cerevisiae YGR047C TFC4 One of six subunits of the RNA polymerase III transcription initiation factor complex (TFIIIC) [Kazachstania barnettii]